MYEGTVEFTYEELCLISTQANAIEAFEWNGLTSVPTIMRQDIDTIDDRRYSCEKFDVAVFWAREIQVSGVADDDVICRGIFKNEIPFPGFKIVDSDFISSGVEGFSAGSEGDAVGMSGVSGKEGFFPIGCDFEEFAVGDIGEVKGAICGDGEAFCPIMSQ